MKEIVSILPSGLRDLLAAEDFGELEEIRIRVGRPVECISGGSSRFYAYETTQEDGMYVLNKLSQFSVYTMEEELRRGYITLQGGHRVGIAGKVITEQGAVKMIRDVASFNIRIAKQKIGIAEPLFPYVHDGTWRNTVIIGPPQTGKTTLLRDFARMMSVGFRYVAPVKVGVVDERSEIAGCIKGIPQHDLGLRVDILDACPKAEGMMMLIRSMSPDVVIVDEIGREEDTDAIMEAIYAGVQVFVTAHGYTYQDLLKRPSLRRLVELGAFERCIELSRQKGPGTVANITDGQGKSIRSGVRST